MAQPLGKPDTGGSQAEDGAGGLIVDVRDMGTNSNRHERFSFALLQTAKAAGLFDASERHHGRGAMWDKVVLSMKAWFV